MGKDALYAKEDERVASVKSKSGSDKFSEAEDEFAKNGYDSDGAQDLTTLDSLDLAQPRSTQDISAVLRRTVPGLQEKYQSFTESTGEVLKNTAKKKLRGYAAHAAVYSTGSGTAGGEAGAASETYKTGFLNLPGSLGEKALFPGVKLIKENPKRGLEDYHPDKLEVSKKWKPNWDLGRYRVTNINEYIKAIKGLYAAAPGNVALHSLVEQRIRSHIKNNNFILPNMAGIAGLHAEVQALNYALSKPELNTSIYAAPQLANTYIFTQRLVGDVNADFPACHNCSGIISGMENVMTGRVQDYKKLERRHSTS